MSRDDEDEGEKKSQRLEIDARKLGARTLQLLICPLLTVVFCLDILIITYTLQPHTLKNVTADATHALAKSSDSSKSNLRRILFVRFAAPR